MIDSIKPPIPVLITAIGGGGHGDQILKALRLAKPGRYIIYGADANPKCSQFSLVEKGFVLPKAKDPKYIDALINLCLDLGAAAVFHGCEPELQIMSKYRMRFDEAGIFLPINPVEVIDVCMDKVRTADMLIKAGFEPPKYVEVTNSSKFDCIDFYPVVVKPRVGSGGSANCFIAQNRDHLDALAILLDLKKNGQKFMVQEYVGTPENEYTVGVLRDMDGNLINSIAIRRVLEGQLAVRMDAPNQTGRTDLGDRLVISSGVSHGYIGDFPEVTQQCEEIAEVLGSTGAINIQCRLVDGKAKVFEINPRFSGTTSLRAMMGYNEPDCLIRRHLLNMKIEKYFPYRHGLILRSLCETEMVSV